MRSFVLALLLLAPAVSATASNFAPDSIDGHVLKQTLTVPGAVEPAHLTVILRTDGRYYEVELPLTVSRGGLAGTFTYTKTGAATAAVSLDPDGPGAARTLALEFAAADHGSYVEGGEPPRPFTLVPVGTAWRLANFANRAISTPDTPCVAGFVIHGTSPRLMLIRVAGPALARFGIAAAAVDPKLRIYQGGDVVAENDNWEDARGQFGDVAEATAATGAFPFLAGSRDAALVRSFAPGFYTFHGLVDAPGEVLVEGYVIP